jgi:hypothetical protein
MMSLQVLLICRQLHASVCQFRYTPQVLLLTGLYAVCEVYLIIVITCL